jgi:hypothetical protein
MRALERTALRAIAAATVATGATQVAAPGRVLGVLNGENTGATRHGFGTVGMFMVCTGGVLLSRPDDRGVVAWTAAQKLGAAVAVGLGVRRGHFSPLGLGVAAFDAASGLLALDYRRRLP